MDNLPTRLNLITKAVLKHETKISEFSDSDIKYVL
jgi:hypothetical protein